MSNDTSHPHGAASCRWRDPAALPGLFLPNFFTISRGSDFSGARCLAEQQQGLTFFRNLQA
jgi:hypothetical protein